MSSSEPNIQLVVERTIDAPRERVFRAWTDPRLMVKWFAPVGMKATEVEADARVGGKYRIGMQEPDGRTYYVTGEYIEVTVPHRLVFTWAEQADHQKTIVTVEFHDRGTATHIVLTHERIPDESMREGNRAGWTNCLEHLQTVLLAGEIV